jgi:ParB family chromosome partitioning protein
MSQKYDRKTAMRATLSAEKKSVDDRFATAEAVLNERPAGLAMSAGPRRTHGDKGTFSAESAEAEQSRSIITVSLENIHDNPLNAREIYDPNIVKELAASLITHKQVVVAPAVKHPDRPGHFILIDGHYRKKAAAMAGLPTLDLEVRSHDSDVQLYRLSWMLNEERSAQSTLDNAFAWRKLIDQGVVRNEGEIAELIGVSLTTVNKSLSLLQLPRAALDKMRERPEKFGVFTGYELTMTAKTVDEAELLSLVNRIVAEDLSTRQVAAIRSKLEEGRLRKRKETSRQYKIRKDGTQIGSLKEWDSGKVTLEIVLLEPKDRTTLVMELRERFGLVD